eukprot:gene5200-biopygen11342
MEVAWLRGETSCAPPSLSSQVAVGVDFIETRALLCLPSPRKRAARARRMRAPHQRPRSKESSLLLLLLAGWIAAPGAASGDAAEVLCRRVQPRRPADEEVGARHVVLVPNAGEAAARVLELFRILRLRPVRRDCRAGALAARHVAERMRIPEGVLPVQ